MFVSLIVVLPEIQTVLLIPNTAVQYASFGDSVFVIDRVETGLVARSQFVKLGEARGDFVTVIAGLQAGDEIVSAGGFKLRNDTAIAINNRLQPDFKLTPHVDDQ